MGTLIINQYLNLLNGFIFTVKTDNPGTSNSDQFTLPTVAGLTYDYQINWGDGTVESITTDAPQTHTYAASGTYEIQINGTFPRIYFNDGGDGDKVTKITDLGRVGWSSMERAFWGANNITEIVRAGDTGNATSFLLAFNLCSSLTSLPFIDTSSGTNFSNFLNNCSSLTSLPPLDMRHGTIFREGFQSCVSLTSFPANLFNNWVGVPDNQCFRLTWNKCDALTAQSVENILVSIDVSGVSAPSGTNPGDRFIEIDYNVATGGLTAATNTAITNLKGKGWEPFINGVFV